MWDGGVRGMVAIMTERTVTSSPVTPRRPLRQLLAASVGNAVEWYDWYW